MTKTPERRETGEEVAAESERGVVAQDTAERAERVAEMDSKGVRGGIGRGDRHGRQRLRSHLIETNQFTLHTLKGTVGDVGAVRLDESPEEIDALPNVAKTRLSLVKRETEIVKQPRAQDRHKG